MSEENGHKTVVIAEEIGEESEVMDVGQAMQEKIEELEESNATLSGELDAARKALEQTARERDLYRQLATAAESNELKLHRELSPYVRDDLNFLRKRNAELEQFAKQAQQLAAIPEAPSDE